MAKATKTVAAKVELTPEQVAANARRATLGKMLNTHALVSATWEAKSKLDTMQSTLRDNARRATNDLADFEMGRFNSWGSFGEESRTEQRRAEFVAAMRELSNIADATVRAYEGAIALGLAIDPTEVTVLEMVRDDGTTRPVAVLAGSPADTEFECFELAMLLGIGRRGAITIRG